MGQESPSAPRIKIRIESLSDLIFGLALSIGSLELIARTPQTPADLGTSVVLFAFSFVVVVSIWVGYTRIMAVLPGEGGSTFALNLVLLFCVALEPYLFYVLQSNPSQDLTFLYWASVGYALDVGGMLVVLASMIYLIVRGRSKDLDLHPVTLRRFRIFMYSYLLTGGVYLVSALPIFWVETPIGFLRFDLWYSAFAFFLVAFASRRVSTRQAPS